MDDIISGGENRSPGGWRKRLVIAAVLVAVAGVVIAEHLPKDSLLGPTRSWAAAARVPRAGSQPGWYWPSIGMTEPILGLPRQASGYVFTRVPGGWAIQAEPAGYQGCAGCPGQPGLVYYLANQSGTARPVAAATMAAPGAGGDDAGVMWLTSFAAHSALGSVAGAAREYTAAGAPAGPPVKLPAGYAIAQATGHGLLLISLSESIPAGTYLWWNPVSGKVIRTLRNVLATSGRSVAYVPACGSSCPVHMLNLVTGGERMVKPPAGSSVAGGTFSPDGRYLALEASSGSGNGSPSLELDVASVATGRLTMVPDTGVSGDALTGFGWPGDGDGLVAEFSFATRVQVTLWSPGMATLAVAGVKADQDPAALVIG